VAAMVIPPVVEISVAAEDTAKKSPMIRRPDGEIFHVVSGRQRRTFYVQPWFLIFWVN